MSETAEVIAPQPAKLDAAFERVPAGVLLLGAMMAFQVGGVLGVWLFPAFGSIGAAWARTLLSGLLLCAVARPRVRELDRGVRPLVLALGVTLAGMNIAFYEAIARIPIGVAVTVSFVGPLCVALFGSRRPRDVAWVVLAATGVALFCGLPGGAALDPVGLAFAVLDGLGWATYALLAKRIGSVVPSSQGMTLGLLTAGIVLLPFVPFSLHLGRATAGTWAALVGVGVLTALPFVLEYAALQRMRAATYGVLVSLEPALATITGVIFLHQHPTPEELLAVTLVVCASVGAARSAGVAVAGDLGDDPGPEAG
jgi:inner membrane transporter RhtA